MDEITEKVLTELEKTQKDFWNISRDSANFLNMLIKATNRKSMLEIGTSNGYSGIWFAKALKENGGTFTTIEFCETRLDTAKDNFKTCGVDDIVKTLNGSAVDILKSMDENKKFDIVFIDANKREYIKYFELIDKMLKKGGVIAADNITSHAEKVQTFVDAINRDDRYQVQILDLPMGLLLAYKNSD